MKYEKEFPIFKTKVPEVTGAFDLSTPAGRAEYFEAKAGSEIKALKAYLAENSFIAYLLAKKSAGKGTYTKLMREIFGDVIVHVSVGDTVRAVHKTLEEGGKEADKLLERLEERYRGYMPFHDAVDALMGRTQDKLLPTEFTLAMLENEIDKLPRKTLFVDGFPRDLDQVSYALFFRSLVDYRSDPDVFVAIDVPESVIDERMKYRVVCPKDQTPRNTKLLTTENVEYDKETETFHLLCDECGTRMVPKEGDEHGIESIRERIDRDQELINKVFNIHGVPKVLVRNAIPVAVADEYVDEYELTPEYRYNWNKEKQEVEVQEYPWTVKDDERVEVYSLLAPPAVLSLIKQLATIFKLS